MEAETRPNEAPDEHPDPGSFQCRICERSYSRADHLVRHVSSHSNQRPFQCPVCLKGFGRRDLLKRHATCHGKPDGNRKHSVQSRTADRVASACGPCAESKLKCSGSIPCQRCQNKGVECRPAAKRHRYPTTQRSTVTFASSPPPEPQRPIASPSGTHETATSEEIHVMQAPTPLDTDMSPLDVVQNAPAASRADDLSPFPLDGFAGLDILNFGIDANLDLDALDFGFLSNFTDCMNTRAPSPVPGASSSEPQVALGMAAFQRSLWLWSPATHDTGTSEHRNLSLPADEHHFTSISRYYVDETLSQAARDRILGLTMQSLQPALIAGVVSSFPSAELLDNFMHLYFAEHASLLDTWIHLPTFRPGESKAELVAAIVAAGAVATTIPSLRKLGYALQEAVRLAMPRLFEGDNSSTRDLQALQAYILDLDNGLWSGNRRKMEIAESHEQPAVTMLRRAGRFRNWTHRQIVPDAEDDERATETKWRQWVEQESFKRLVFHLFLHDAQASMSLLVTPLISLAEITIPLPESRELWTAKDAQTWKRAFLALPRGRSLPTLAACLADLSLIDEFESRLDLRFVSAILVYGCWGMVWSYRQHRSIAGDATAQPLLRIRNETRHGELAASLDRLRRTITKWPRAQCPEVTIVLELLMMHLSVPFEDLQLFAGKEGESAARSVSGALRNWADDRDARAGVWYAGQILRAAKSMPRDTIGRFEAIAVYYSSLTLWGFAVVGRGRLAGFGSNLPMPTVMLDGESDGDSMRFIEMQQGIPGFAGISRDGAPAAVARLDDPQSIMVTVLEILQRGASAGPLPPLVDNLCQLIRDLGTAAQQRSLPEMRL